MNCCARKCHGQCSTQLVVMLHVETDSGNRPSAQLAGQARLFVESCGTCFCESWSYVQKWELTNGADKWDCRTVAPSLLRCGNSVESSWSHHAARAAPYYRRLLGTRALRRLNVSLFGGRVYPYTTATKQALQLQAGVNNNQQLCGTRHIVDCLILKSIEWAIRAPVARLPWS
jgi:hypothetical protein